MNGLRRESKKEGRKGKKVTTASYSAVMTKIRKGRVSKAKGYLHTQNAPGEGRMVSDRTANDY